MKILIPTINLKILHLLLWRKHNHLVPGKKIDKTKIIGLEKGKIPPQALDLEDCCA